MAYKHPSELRELLAQVEAAKRAAREAAKA